MSARITTSGHLAALAYTAMAVATLVPSAPAGEPLTASETTVDVSTTYRYWEYIPEGYETSEGSFPLILFLHGGGESGEDIELVVKHGIPKELIGGRRLPCIVLAPQNPDPKGLWDDRALLAFLDDHSARLKVDPSRIYVTGMSRGGHGAFRLVAQDPERFAAAAIVCGGGPVTYAAWAKDVPFWFFHGDRDTSVPTEESRRLASAIRKHGGEAKLTIYPDTGHDSWEQAYADDALYTWLLSKQKR